MANRKLVVDLNKEQGWITFLDEEFGKVWHPILINEKHALFHDFFTMELAREKFSCRKFGIASTSQMIIGNIQRDNL